MAEAGKYLFDYFHERVFFNEHRSVDVRFVCVWFEHCSAPGPKSTIYPAVLG